MSPYILVLDPSLTNTGFVVYECQGPEKFVVATCGVITTAPSNTKNNVFAGDDIVRRWKEIVNALKKLNEHYNFSLVAAEVTNGGVQSNSAAQSLFGSKALVTTYTEMLSVPSLFVSPRQVKEALASDPSATKETMMLLANEVADGIGDTHFKDVTKSGKPGKKRFASKFEHVADAVGVFQAVRTSTIVKMMSKVVGNES